VTAFTRLGSCLWIWEPWVSLPSKEAKLLWLALYTSGAAKRNAPGLWEGGISSMTDASRMGADDVIGALDVLLDCTMVEYDKKVRVLRLCALPDAGEYPSNGKVILGWWTRFRSIPECDVRDAHVTTLRWIIDTGARQAGRPISADHENAWRDTFAQVKIPLPRRRGVRQLADSDTSTHVQPSLFPSPFVASGYGNGIAPQGESSYPQNPQPSVDNSAVMRQPKEIPDPETISDTISDTNRIPDPGSRIPEIWISSGEGGGGRGARPVLALVPPYSAEDVLRELSQGNWDPAFDRTHQNALSAMIPTWVAAQVGLVDIALLREYSQLSGPRMSVRWLLGCDITAEISRARRTIDWRDARAKVMADSLP
jgi:hypothetical protein